MFSQQKTYNRGIVTGNFKDCVLTIDRIFTTMLALYEILSNPLSFIICFLNKFSYFIALNSFQYFELRTATGECL
jgi:hypothetical protein